MSWKVIELADSTPAPAMDGDESFDTMGGYAHTSLYERAVKLGAWCPSTNKDGFMWSIEQAEILTKTQVDLVKWTHYGIPCRVSINSVAGSGKTTLIEGIAKLICNMGLGNQKIIMTAFNTHIAKALGDVAKSLKKSGLTGFKSMGYSNTASAGGRELLFKMIRANGMTPIQDDQYKYRSLSRQVFSEIAGMKEMLIGITSQHEEIKNPVAGWMSGTRAIEHLVSASMASGIITETEGSIDSIKKLITSEHGQRDDVVFLISFLGVDAVANAVEQVIERAMDTLVSDIVYRADKDAVVPDSVSGYYSRRSLVSVAELLAQPNGHQIHRQLGVDFPYRKEVPKQVMNHELGSLAKVQNRGGVSGTYKVLIEDVDDGSACFRSASYAASNIVMGSVQDIETRLGVSFQYVPRNNQVVLRNLIRTASEDNQAPVPECQYRYIVSKDRAQILKAIINEVLGAKNVEYSSEEVLTTGVATSGSNATVPVSMQDFVYGCVYHNLTDPAPAAMIMIDEVQDFSQLQGRFLQCFSSSNTSMICVGDVRQSLYLFNFANSKATKMIINDFNCDVMPMTICWRNSKNVVYDVHQFVNQCIAEAGVDGYDKYKLLNAGMGDYSAHKCPDADYWPDGKRSVVMPAHLLPYAAQLGDIVSCRINAPLAKLALRTLVDGEKSITLPAGKKGIGEEVMSIVKGGLRYNGAHQGFGLLNGDEAREYLDHDTIEKRYDSYMDTNYEAAVKRCGGDLTAAKSEATYVKLADIADAAQTLLHGYIDRRGESGTAPMAKFEGWLNTLCGETEGRSGHDNTIRFASVHRTKGAQGKQAFVITDRINHEGQLKPTFMLPHCMNNAAEVVQEINAAYVAATRAIDRVVFVSFSQALADKYPTWESFSLVWNQEIEEGQKVVATQKIIDQDNEYGVIANTGDSGEVIHVAEDGFPCVRFESGLATDVSFDQIVEANKHDE